MVPTSAYRPPLRLTRRGRAVVVAGFVLLSSLASVVLFSTASRASDPDLGPPPTVEVQPYDTLWAIATRAEPMRDPYAAVAEIEQLNGLHDCVVEPGRILVLPRDR